MRFTPTLDEFSAMRPLIDLVEQKMAARHGMTLEQYRADRARLMALVQQGKKS